jgi:hypothetical protein
MAGARLPDLILAGFGASDALQITVEAQQAVVRAGRVLALAIPARLRTLLERQGVEITDLDDRFAGAAAAEAYAATAAAVLAGAALVRTHDVTETRDAVRVAEALRAATR